MSHEQFELYVRGTPGRGDFSWADHLFPKMTDVIYKTLKGVSESMEQRSNCFEVYGFDIILD